MGPGGPQQPHHPPYGHQQPPQGYPQGGYPPQQPGMPLGYASPMPGGMPAGQGRVIDIGEIARRQRAVMFCLLAYIALILIQLAINGAVPANNASTGGKNSDMTGVAMVVGFVGLGVIVTTTVFVFRLALSLYDQGLGVLLGILTIIPCVGIVVLLFVNAKATGILRRHGISVGLMGANASQIPPVGTMSREFAQRQAPGAYPQQGGYPPR
jgi:hypothetical protein